MDWWMEHSMDDLFSDEESVDSVAMRFFEAIGHTCTSAALFSDNDPMHFVYGTLATKAVLSPSDRATLLQVQTISLLFKMDGSLFDNSHCRPILYFAVDLPVSAGTRSSSASEIQLALSRIAKERSVVFFRSDGEYMLSFTAPNPTGKESVVLSDWFSAGSHSDSFYETLAAFNFSFASSNAFYADFRHAAARQYYTYPCSREFALYEVLPSLINDSDERESLSREDIAEMVRDILLEPVREYGDDYVDDENLIDYSSDEFEDTDFDLLEYELEQMGAFDEDFQEAPFDDETDLALQEGDSKKPTFDSSDIPAEIMRDPVKLLAWLDEHEREKDTEPKSRSQKTEDVNTEELLVAALELEDLDYIDNRKKGGVFWIIGGLEISDYVQGLNQKLGYSFAFKAGGGHATTGEDAWWTK